MSSDLSDTAYSNVERAEALVDLSRPAEALELLAIAIASDPEYGYAWCIKARAHIAARDYADALDACAVAIACMPEDDYPHRLAGIALLNLPGRQGHAIEAARRSVELAPLSWQSHYLLGLTLVDHRRHRDEARAVSDRVLELAPHAEEAHELAGEVALAQRRRKDAREHFERALSINPESAEAHAGLGRVNLVGFRFPTPKRFAAAATDFASGLRADPTAAESRYNLELALRTGIAWAAYFLFLVAYFVVRIAADSNTITARLVPIAFLLLPAVFLTRFTIALRPDVRAHLASRIRRGVPLIATTLIGLAVALMIAGSLAPQHYRPPLAIATAVTALLARIALWVEGENQEGKYESRS